MQKWIQRMFLLVLLFTVGTLQAQTFNYVCNFEASTVSDDWVFVNGDCLNQWVINTAVNNTTNGNHSLYISDDNGLSNEYDNSSPSMVYAYHEISLDEGVYDFSYDWRCQGESSSSGSAQFDYLRVALVPDTTTFTAGGYLRGFSASSVPYGWIEIDGGALNHEVDWQHHSTEVNVSSSSTYKLVFIWKNDNGGGSNPPAAIDNIVVKQKTCFTPTNLTFTNITSNGVDISWTETGQATMWQIEWGPAGFTRGTGTMISDVYENPYYLMGLSPSTLYDVYVESNCIDDTSNAVKGTFRTACGDMELPMFEDFEDYAYGEFPMCWFKKEGIAQVDDYDYYAYNGNNSLALKNNATIITPKFFIAGNEASIYFAAMCQYPSLSGVLEIGYVTDTSAWDYTPVQQISAYDNKYHIYSIDFDEIDVSENIFMVIRQLHSSEVYYGWYLDDVTLMQMGNCAKPTDYMFTNITANSATLSWLCDNSDASFQIKYIDDHSTIIHNVANGVNQTTISDLTPNTVYAPFIRSICGEGDTSVWVEMGAFSTDPICSRIVDLSIENTTSNAAVISWRYSEIGNPHSGVLFRYKQDGTDTWNEVMVNGVSYMLTDLLPSVNYNIEVATLCTNDDGIVDTSSVRSLNLSLPSGLCGEYVGEGDTRRYIPTNTNFKNSYTQAIYENSNLMGMDTIRGIAYHVNEGNTTRNIAIYLANTTKIEFDNGVDYLLGNQLTRVYAGDIDFSDNSWDSVTFDTPFAVTPGSNIVVAVVDSTNAYTSSSVKFYSHEGSGLYVQSDYTQYQPSIFNANMSTEYNVADIRFIGECVAPTCKAPLVSVTAVTENSISVQWVAGLDETSWTVDYRALGSSSWNNISDNTESTSVIISDLQLGSGYEIRVGSLCSDDTLYNSVVAYTSCGIFTAPYCETFSSDRINTCWRYGNIAMTDDEPYISNHQLSMPANCYLILSEFTDDINTLQLRFNMNDNGKHAPLLIGVVSEKNNIRTFELIDTVYVDITNPDADIICRLNNYEGSGAYIALKTAANNVKIDNLNIEAIPLCPQPLHLHVVSVGAENVTISWDADESATAWSATIVPVGQDISNGQTLSVNESRVEFSNLLPNTNYNVYISAICDEHVSPMANMTITTLSADPIDLPYLTDFTDEAQNSQWTFLSLSNDINGWTIGNATNNNNSNSLYISNNDGISNAYTISEGGVYLAYVPVFIPEDGVYALAYDWKGKGEAGYDFGRIALVPVNYNLATAPNIYNNYRTTLPMDWIAMDGGQQMADNNTWTSERKKVNLNSGIYFLTILWANDNGSGIQPPLAIDNISFSQITCPDPENVQVVDITTTEATLTWDYSDVEMNGWEVSLNNANPIIVTDTFYTFTNLNPNSFYTASIRTICSEDNPSITITRNFTTDCGEISNLPYFVDFSNESTDNYNVVPHCWTSTTNGYPTISDQYTDNPALYFCGKMRYSGTSYIDNIVSMPMLSNTIDWSDVELQFRGKSLRNSVYNQLYIGVCSTPGDISTFTCLDTLSDFSSDWNNYIISFNDYAGAGRYVTFYVHTNDYYEDIDVILDDVQLQKVSPCARPTVAFIDSYTHNSVTVGWNDTNSMATYKIAYSTENNVNNTENIISDIVASPYTISDLNSNTTYYVWVAADCSNCDTVSGWVSAGSFTTHPSCGEITNLKVIDVNETQATITWQAPLVGEPVTDYIVSYKMNNNALVFDTVQSQYYFMDNLVTDSSYTVMVTTLCSDELSESNVCTFVPSIPPSCNELGQGTLEKNCPTPGNWNYAFTQLLYLADELVDMGDTIHGVTFNHVERDLFSRDITVYMAETDLSQFTDSFEPIANMTQVYTGTWQILHGNSPITFTTPFVRTDHSKNLILVIDDNSGVNDELSHFYATDMERDLAIYAYQDRGDLNDQSSARGTSTLRPNTIFDATCQVRTCKAPSVVFANIADTQIDIAWRAGNDETSWKVDYRMANDADWTTLYDNTTATTASFNNLMPGECYYFRVGAICGSDIQYRTIHTQTLCGATPTPYYQNFDSYVNVNFEKQCWGYGGYTNPFVQTINGDNSMLRLYNDSYVALPTFDHDLNELQIHLRYLAPSDTVWLLIGYVDNVNEIHSFHVLDTLYDYDNVMGYYHTICYNSVAATNGHIAIYTPHRMDYTYIDDIVVEPIRTCVEPSNVVVSNITATEADVSWTGTASNYLVEYGAIGFTLGNGTQVNANGNSIHLTNLESGAVYDIYVSSLCGNDTSYSTNVVRFSTNCAPYSELQYVMNFDLSYLPAIPETQMIPNCWTVPFMDDANASMSQQPQIFYDEDHLYTVNGDYVLRMSANGMIALPEMAMDVNTLCVRFNDYVTDNNSRLVVGVLDHVNQGCESTFQPIDTIAPASVNQSERYVVFLNSYAGTGKYIALRNYNVIDNQVSLHYIDSLVVEPIPACAEVGNLRMISSTANTITLDWNDATIPNEGWQIEYGVTGFEHGDGLQFVTTSHPITILELDTLTSYDIWVRPICAEGDTGVWTYRPLTARTNLCALPYITTTAPNGYSETSKRFPFAPLFNYSYDQTIIKAEQLSGQSDIVAMNFVATQGSEDVMNGIRIWMGHTNKTKFNTDTDWYPSDSLNLVYSGNLTYDAGVVTVMFDTPFNYDGTSNVIIALDRDDGSYASGHEFAIVATTDTLSLYHRSDDDNFDLTTSIYDGTLETAQPVFEFISCNEGQCGEPILSDVTNISDVSATIHWTGTSTHYQVALRPQHIPIMSEVIDVINNNDYTFTNLIPNTNYIYSVRQVCDNGATSNWSEAEFTTMGHICLVPTNLMVVDKTENSVTLSWTSSDSEQNRWTIHVFNTIDDIYDTVNVNPATIMNLSQGQTYQVAVNAFCEEDLVSDWSDTIEFSTDDCLPVSNVAVSDITVNSAKVSWTAGDEETQWEINYGDEGFGQGEGEIVEANTNNYTITGLESETSYDVYVRALCSDNFYSVWSEVVTFETLADDTPEGIDGVDGNYSLSIYPNPTNGATTIKLNGIEGEVEISIVDMNGRMLMKETMSCGSDCEKCIDVAGLAQGTYFVRVVGDEVNSVRKLIVR